MEAFDHPTMFRAIGFLGVFSVVFVLLQRTEAWAVKRKVHKHNRPPEEKGVPGAVESDMILTPEQMKLISKGVQSTRFKRKAVTHESYLWPQGILVYEFDEDMTPDLRATMLMAMKQWSDSTCVRFRQYSPEVAAQLGHHDRVRYFKGFGCHSSIGKVGGVQSLTIGQDCPEIGSAVHELGHSLGLYHEQSRPDRDSHVTVYFDNVEHGKEGNFKKYGNKDISTDEPYDVGSIMHYGPQYFAKDDSSITIDPKLKRTRGFMGQRDELSFYDIKTINELYNCTVHCPKKRCDNGGYVGEKCTCKCPIGLAGPSCSDVAESTAACGGKFESPSGTFTSPGFPSGYGVNQVCHWLIQGPPGSSITLKFERFALEDDPDGPCNWDWLEIRDQGPEKVGSRYCGSGPSGTIEYPGNALYLRLKSDADYTDTGFKASYKINEGAGWFPWESWSACSKPCGGGTRFRRRECPSGNCEGSKMDVGTCNSQHCTY